MADTSNHITEMKQRLATSEYAVTKVVSLLPFLSDQDKDFVIAQVQASKGNPQTVRIPPTRNRKSATVEGQ